MQRDITELNGNEVMMVIRTDEFVISTAEDRVSSAVADEKGIHFVFNKSQTSLDIAKEKVKDVFVLEDQTQIILESGVKIVFEICLTDD